MRVPRLSLLLLLAGCVDGEFVDSEIASSEQALGGPGCDLTKLHNLRYDDIPLNTPTLEIHTCDLSGAGTNDDIEVRFQVGTKTYQ
jgi:hypothetical protein